MSALWDMLLRQSNISALNIGQAAAWAAEGDAEVSTLARLVIDIGRAHPRKKKRLPSIRRNHRELWERMLAAGLVEDFEGRDIEFEDEFPFEFDEPEDRFALSPSEEPADDEDDEEEIPF